MRTPIVGVEWVVDAAGCDPAALRDAAAIEALLAAIVRELELRIVGKLVHPFPSPGGVTAMFLLAESHLTCHTYPEHGVATFNLACCRPRPEWPWSERLAESFGATRVRVRRITRGGDEESTS